MRQVARTLAVFGAIACVLALSGSAQAQTQTATVSSDQPAGLIVFPRIVSDPSDLFDTGVNTDTVIQITNTDDVLHVVHCFYVSATSTCSTGTNTAGTAGGECRTAADCVGTGARCDPNWGPIRNFDLVLSPNQPVGWTASTGAPVGAPGDGGAPPVALDFFEGELKCIEVDGTSVATSDALPIDANDLQGAATIYTYATGTALDIRSYNAVGIQAVTNGDAVDDAANDQTLCLGGNGITGNVCATAEYAACPARLILDHWFEGATYTDGATVSTSITFAPCTERLDLLQTDRINVQVLTFNEFEQRLSANLAVECVETLTLGEISRIFDVTVQGTLTGQTSFRPVASGTPGAGAGLIAIAEEFIDRETGPDSSTAFQVNQSGVQEGVADIISYTLGTGDPNTPQVP